MSQAAERIEHVQQGLAGIREQVGRVIVGMPGVVEHLLVALLADGHVLLEGPPGLGKTRLVRALAASLDLEFKRLQCTPDLMPSDVTGSVTLVPAEGGPHLRFDEGPVFTNLLLADEINRTTPKTQAALLEAMEERTVTTAGRTRPLPDPFVVLATQNPVDMEGTYPLPEAQLDRFLLKVEVPSPGVEELVEIVRRTTAREKTSDAPRAAAAEGTEFLAEARDLVRSVALAPALLTTIAELVLATHPGDGADPDIGRLVRYGASPRAAISLSLAARARAVLNGRPHVSREDLAVLAPAAFRHRIILSFEAEADGVTSDDILAPLFARILGR